MGRLRARGVGREGRRPKGRGKSREVRGAVCSHALEESGKMQGQGPALTVPSILFLNCFFDKIGMIVIISVLCAS